MKLFYRIKMTKKNKSVFPFVQQGVQWCGGRVSDSKSRRPDVHAHLCNAVLITEALPGVLGIQGEGLFIFRDLGRMVIYFQGFGEKA